MHRFDKDGDGTVDVVEFTKTFFKMGFDERDRRAKAKREAEAVREGLGRRGRGAFGAGRYESPIVEEEGGGSRRRAQRGKG